MIDKRDNRIKVFTAVKRRRRAFLTAAIIVSASAVIVASGFATDILIGVASRIRLSMPYSVAGPLYYGPTSLEERIVRSDVVARVRLNSVNSTVDIFAPNEQTSGYVSALEYEFDVLEYVKGSGSAKLVGVAYDTDTLFDTKVGATLMGVDLLSSRDTRWDDREAIVFLISDHPVLPSSSQPDRYILGITDSEWHKYTISSVSTKRWLPEASPQSDLDAASSRDTAAVEKRFLLDSPSETSVSTAYSTKGVDVSVAEDGTPTIYLSELKKLIAELEAEEAAGDGSDAYRDCIYHKYKWERQVACELERLDGKYYHILDTYDLGSGLPAGTFVYYSRVSGNLQRIRQEKPGPTGLMPSFSKLNGPPRGTRADHLWLGNTESTTLIAEKST